MNEYKINENKELNASVREYSEGKEYRAPQEFGDSEPNFDAKEDNTGSTRAQKPGKAKRKNRIGDMLKIFCIATAAVIAVTAATLLPKNTSAEIISLTVTDTSISYTVNVSGDDVLELVVYNDFTHRTESLTHGENDGKVEGLKPDIRYRVAVVCNSGFGNRTIAEKSVRTGKDAPAPLVTELLSVEHQCTCDKDGYFHFTLNFTDGNGYWSDFTAKLTDSFGTVSSCKFNDDIHAEQKIDVAVRAGLLGKTATFIVACKTTDPSAQTDAVILYEANVLI